MMTVPMLKAAGNLSEPERLAEYLGLGGESECMIPKALMGGQRKEK